MGLSADDARPSPAVSSGAMACGHALPGAGDTALGDLGPAVRSQLAEEGR